VRESVRNASVLEAVATLALRTLALRPETAEVRDHLLERHFDRKHGPGAYYGNTV
jgi:L-ribulose-5-phosphate 4-epimerase